MVCNAAARGSEIAVVQLTGAALRHVALEDLCNHCCLEDGDDCRYLWDYRPGQAQSGPVNLLLSQFKIRPSVARQWPGWERAKARAISTLAAALSGALVGSELCSATWVPIPPSCAVQHSDYDARLLQCLQQLQVQPRLDVRPALYMRRSLAADHLSTHRARHDELWSAMGVDNSQLDERPLGGSVVLFDDMLTSGKHFRVCKDLLRQTLGPVTVRGVFLTARRRPRRWLGDVVAAEG